VANGVVSSTINGLPSGTVSATGTVSASGSVTFSVTGACGGGTITFTGVATTNQSGGAVMIGSADQPAGGTCAGSSSTWKATRTITTGVVVESEIPATLALLQSYPNPFNPTATIEYHVPVSGFVKLSVYNILGREITLLVNENKSVGNHRVTFDASGLSGGVYFYRMQAGQFQETRKLVLLK
jgi:hypothetical protein